VSGNRLTIREGTRTRTYRTLSITVPSNARIRNAGHPAALSQLTPGEHVLVTQGTPRMRVVARPARTR